MGRFAGVGGRRWGIIRLRSLTQFLGWKEIEYGHSKHHQLAAQCGQQCSRPRKQRAEPLTTFRRPAFPHLLPHGLGSHDLGLHPRIAGVVTDQDICAARFRPRLAALVDHPVRVLVSDGRIRRRELHRCGITRTDIEGVLRERGVSDLADVAYLLYEHAGQFTVVSRDRRCGPLVAAVVGDRPNRR